MCIMKNKFTSICLNKVLLRSAWFVGLLLIILLLPVNSPAEDLSRWQPDSSGGIVWKTDNRLPHYDDIEMSGQSVSTILHYGVNANQSFSVRYSVAWPMLRIIPNDTYGTLSHDFNTDLLSSVKINGYPVESEKVNKITLNGLMTVNSVVNNELECTRVLFPSINKAAFYVSYQICNKSRNVIVVEIPNYQSMDITAAEKGVSGSYEVVARSQGQGIYTLKSGEKIVFGLQLSACKKEEVVSSGNISEERQLREKLVSEWESNLVLDTPDEILNRAFAFAKIRAAESIFKTKGGYMHCPGGGAYYAAIWTNDQAEYSGPFFPYLGYTIGNEAALNAYLLFAKYMNPEYKPIPSSIIAEGTDIWNGAGDRGDAAMIAFGASRYALAQGDKKVASELWPLIQWCLEYCHRKLNNEGVVTSNCDELEGRFPAGKANLCTSSLYFDALHSAVYLGKELGVSATDLAVYSKEADALKLSIDRYFGRKIEGFESYRYYDGNDVLRAWICIPLTVGIFDRKQGTIDALFSPRLWTLDGLASQAGDKTFWDRSTLYALRGVFAAGETEKALHFLQYYSQRRLLGEHVPYPVEAYPEGNQRHLSAESALYCRVFTEGLFGLRPVGLNSFAFTPELPKEWNHMALHHIKAFGKDIDLSIERKHKKLKVTVSQSNRIICNKVIFLGRSIRVTLR